MTGKHRLKGRIQRTTRHRAIEVVDARTLTTHFLTRNVLSAGRLPQGRYIARCGQDILPASLVASIAEWYSGNLSQEAQKGLRKKVEIGGTPGKAPLGYRNIRDKRKGKDIGLVTVDAIMGPIITQAFSLYATGLCTLSALTDELNHLGLRMLETRSLPERPVQIQHVHRILRNHYYLGIITYSGIDYQGEHIPLVDETTFELVQAILTSRNLNKQKSKKRPHPLKGNLFCARCGRRLGITAPTNRHGTPTPTSTVSADRTTR